MQPWKDRWFHDVPALLARTKDYYAEFNKNPFRVTAKQIINLRGWEVQDPEGFVSTLEELSCLYVPSAMDPGPMVVFPEVDTHGEPLRAQTKPLYELLAQSKYVTIGVSKRDFCGPVWLGNQPETLERILKKGHVVVCEGPFDLLALRIANPEIPSLSSLTKNLGEDHLLYLRLLGVRTLHLMYDNELSEAGEKSMRILKKNLHGIMDVNVLLCPADDPSDCLKSRSKTKALQSILADL